MNAVAVFTWTCLFSVTTMAQTSGPERGSLVIVGGGMLGLTLGCARCHDHKFDPIPTADYYALAGIFKSTKTMDSLKTIAKWHEHSFATPAEKKLKEKHDALIAAQKKVVTAFTDKANQQLLVDLKLKKLPLE